MQLHIHKLSNLVLLFLSVTIANLCLLKPVNGDEALIGKVCAETQWPDSCHRCLSTPEGIEAKDEKELAGISINCSVSLSNVVVSDFDEISKGSSDAEVKLICESCRKSILEALQSLMGAQVDCSNGKFDDASDKAAMAFDSYSICSQIFGKIPAPAPYKNDFTTLKEHILNNEAIIDSLVRLNSHVPAN